MSFLGLLWKRVRTLIRIDRLRRVFVSLDTHSSRSLLQLCSQPSVCRSLLAYRYTSSWSHGRWQQVSAFLEVVEW